MSTTTAGVGAGLRSQVAALLDRAIDRYHGASAAQELVAARHRLDEPLRVAIAGKVKAGKSTLLNALVGERLAPTDAGECTRIVTWYEHGLTYRVTLEPDDGAPVQVPFRRQDGHLEVRLDGHPAHEVRRLRVAWPAGALRTLTLIDTPGIASLSADVSARTTAFLAADDRPAEADAVCYLMRHLHATDVRFLEGFHDDETANATPMNAIAVLSRADEIGVGRVDAMQTAQVIARRYRTDDQVRRLCQTVLPVAGLLAETATTLRQDEHAALAQLAALDREDTEALLLSADRFVSDHLDVTLPSEIRAGLLDRFGLFGVRLSIALLRAGAVGSAPSLAAALVSHSGIEGLREALTTQFSARAELLKARTALVTLEQLLRSHPAVASDDLAGEVERILASTHAFAEARLLNALRAGNVPLRDDALVEAERLLGGHGADTASRLHLPEASPPEVLRTHAIEALQRWQRRAEHPLTSPEGAEAARHVLRSCEGLLADLTQLASRDPSVGR